MSITNELLERKNKLLALMEDKSLDAVLMSSNAQIDHRANLRYFIDYHISVYEEYLLLDSKGNYTFIAHDSLSAKAAEENDIVAESLVIDDYYKSGVFIAKILEKKNIKKLGIGDFRTLNANTYVQIVNASNDVIMVDLYENVVGIRKSKSFYEYNFIKEAVLINDKSVLAFIDYLRIDGSLLTALRQAQSHAEFIGAQDQYWMIGKGQRPRVDYNIALRKNDEIITKGDYITLVAEHSSIRGYWGETYNIISVGPPEEDVAMAYKFLADIQTNLQEKMKPGVEIGRLASFVKGELIDAGYLDKKTAENISLTIGHCQGLDAFEYPVFTESNLESLEAGMQIALHPGIGLKDGTNVSLCMCYFIHEDRAERLTTLSDEIYQI